MKTKALQIIMPMAGEGSRFQQAGFSILKPLIQVQGEALYHRALRSFTDHVEDLQVTFIIRKDHDREFDLKNTLLASVPEAQVILLSKPTRGPLETLSTALESMDAKIPVVSLDSDLWFTSSHYLQWLLGLTPAEEGGAVVGFSSQNPAYSYAQVENGFVQKTAEKIVISSHALAGAYGFSSGSLLKDLVPDALKNFNSMNGKEPTISLLYNELIRQGLKVRYFSTDQYLSFGTPEELRASELSSLPTP